MPILISETIMLKFCFCYKILFYCTKRKSIFSRPTVYVDSLLGFRLIIAILIVLLVDSSQIVK